MIFIKKVPQQPGYRRKRLLKNLIKQEDKNSNDDDIVFVKKVSSKNRTQRALKQQAEKVKFVKKIPQHPRERRKRKPDKKHFYSQKLKRNELQLND